MAASGASPPIGTDASVTPSGTTVGAGVVVVVPVVVGGGSSASTAEADKPAASMTSRRSAQRFTKW
jgi:hypothetical protein